MEKINIIKLLWKKKIALIVAFSILFVMGYFISEFYVNSKIAYYSLSFTSEASTSEVLNLTEQEYFDSVIDKITAYNQDIDNKVIEGKKITYASVDFESLVKDIKIIKYSDHYELRVPLEYFKTISKKTGDLNYGVNRVDTFFKLFYSSNYNDLNISFIYNGNNISSRVNYQNSLIIGVISGAIGLIALALIFSIIFMLSKDKTLILISDNKEVFSSPFHKAYWVSASKEFKSVKSMTTVSILFACELACKFIPIPSGFGSLGLGLSYLFLALIAMLYGPIVGLVIGALSDILGFYMIPSGYGFFIGYVFDSMLACFMYGLCFYKSKITFTRCFYARVFVNLYINVIQGSTWWSIINNFTFNQFKDYLLIISLPKNLVYLLPQALLLFITFKLLAKPLKQCGLVSESICDNVTWF